MPRLAVALVAALIIGAVPQAFSQNKDVDVGWVYASAPKPGMVKQLEEGRKRHMDFHRKQGDTWRWQVWLVETGENTGSYYSTTFGHSWKDLDAWDTKMRAADTVDGDANLTPYVASETASIWMVMKDVSRMSTGTEMPKMAEVNHFLLKPGREGDFNDAVHKVNDAITKTDWPVHYTWYALQDGGEGPHYVLLVELNGWADLAEPNPSFDAMLEKAVGRHDAESIMKGFADTVRREWTETIRFRPDLSYIPATK